jgi:hypothetical protein
MTEKYRWWSTISITKTNTYAQTAHIRTDGHVIHGDLQFKSACLHRNEHCSLSHLKQLVWTDDTCLLGLLEQNSRCRFPAKNRVNCPEVAVDFDLTHQTTRCNITGWDTAQGMFLSKKNLGKNMEREVIEIGRAHV